jgi:hypothetical protein
MNYETSVMHYFEHLGYIADKIPEGKKESPDFLIHDDSINIVVELKTKLPSDDEISQRKLTIESGNIHNIQEQIVRKNMLSRITKHAAAQLKNYPLINQFNLEFLLSTGHLAEPRFQQFEASLYGCTTIVDSTKRFAQHCYFFYESDFYRDRDILDAAIVSTETEHLLLINPHSPRASAFRACSLCKRFDGGIIDPIELDRQGKAFYVDGAIDRQDEQAVMAYLRKKYASDTLIKIDMNFLSGTMQFQ